MERMKERPGKDKVIALIEIGIITTLAFLFVYVACVQVDAGTVSDGDVERVLSISEDGLTLVQVDGVDFYAVSPLPERDGYTLVQIDDTTGVYVSDDMLEHCSYWIVFGSGGNYYTGYSDDLIVYHPSESRICFTWESLDLMDSTGDASAGAFIADASCDLCGLQYCSTMNVSGVYAGTYAVQGAEDGEGDGDEETQEEIVVTVTFPPVATEVPFFEATPEDLSTTNILLLLIFLVLLADFILKHIGGIFTCMK